MPNFNILRTIGRLRTSPRPAPIIAKDFAYDNAGALSPANSVTQPRSAFISPEIIKSQPITDPSLGRRGTLKKKNKHRYHIPDGAPMDPMVLQSESQYPQDDVLPGLPIIAQQSSGYEHATISTSILPEKYPFPYEDNHQQRFQINTSTDSGTPVSGGMSGFDNGLPTAYPDFSAPQGGIHPKHNGRHHSRHHHRHHHHCRQSRSPQRYEHEVSYATPPTHDYSHSSPKHTSWEPEHSRTRSRSRSFTPIPSVYREPDSMGDPYADPMIQENSAHLIGTNGNRRSLHRSSERLVLELDQDHGPSYTQQPVMIEWLPNTRERQVDEEPQTMHDPEATLVGESEPQIISPPVGRRENRNVYHTCEPDHEPDASYLRRRALAQNHAYENRRHKHNRTPEEPRIKIHTPYRDHHYSETIEPRIYERCPSLEGSDSDPDEYCYIVPSGAHVVFRDHNGSEIARIGEPGHIAKGRSRRDLTTFTVQDEHGNILYRHGTMDGGHYRDDRYLRPGDPQSRRPVKVIMIDEHGNQIPVHPSQPYHPHRSHQIQYPHDSQHSYHSQDSHSSQYSHYSQHSHPCQHLQHSLHSQPLHLYHHPQHSYPSYGSHGSGRQRA